MIIDCENYRKPVLPVIFLRRKREMAPMGNAAAFPEHLAEGNSTAQVHWCTARSPDVSLRGAKRRGNLAVPGWITGRSRRIRRLLQEIAASACGLLAMTNLQHSPFYRQPVSYAGAAPGPAVPSPTRRVRPARLSVFRLCFAAFFDIIEKEEHRLSK